VGLSQPLTLPPLVWCSSRSCRCTFAVSCGYRSCRYASTVSCGYRSCRCVCVRGGYRSSLHTKVVRGTGCCVAIAAASRLHASHTSPSSLWGGYRSSLHTMCRAGCGVWCGYCSRRHAARFTHFSPKRLGVASAAALAEVPHESQEHFVSEGLVLS
jgi:hypothetical protein